MATVDKNFIVKNGLTVEGSTIISPAATTSFASLRIPHGTAPSSPINGDIWSTTTGVFARVNGSTVGPLGPSGGTAATPIALGTVHGYTEDVTKNTAFGYQANANLSGYQNMAIGHRALFQSTGNSAVNNTAVGISALQGLTTTGEYNVALGMSAAQSFTTGNQNTIIGAFAGSNNAPFFNSGSNNILIGFDSRPSASAVSNEITLGNPSNNRLRIPGLGVDWTSSTVPVVQEIIPLDDISNDFNGANTRFIPNYQGTKVTINNPFRLLLTINGIMQYIDSPDYVWMSGVPRRGFFVDYEGQIQFSEPVPPGSEFDARLMPGDVNTTRTRTYPFRALDILLGG